MDTFVANEVPSHAMETLNGLDHFRRNFPEFCDFTLVLDNQTFPCHRSILCLHSDYFRAAIRGKYVEHCTSTTYLKDIDPRYLSLILDYIYTGRIEINQATVEGILETASRIQMQKVLDLCVSYLRHQIDETNALAMHRYGIMQGIPELAVAAKHFTYDRMEAIFGVEDVVKNLTLEEVEEIVGDSLAHLHGEEQIVMSILKWVSFDQEGRMKQIEKLIQNINWSRMSTRFILRTLLNHPLLEENKSAKDLIVGKIRKVLNSATMSEHPTPFVHRSSIMDEGISSSGNFNLMWTNRNRMSDHMLGGGETGCKEEVLLLIGGLTLGEAERGDVTQPNVMSYCPREENWTTRANWPERKLRGFSVTKFHNDVIVTGGCEYTEMKKTNISRVWMYVVHSDTWKRMPDMIQKRSFHGSCEVNGEVFVLGGSMADKIDMEVFDPLGRHWCSSMENTPKFVWNFTVAPCNGKILLVGSCQNSRSLVLQCYNPSVAQWSLFRSPNIPRPLSAPVCTAAGNRIFLSGDNSQKMFMFDPNKNVWSRARDMHDLHSNGGMTKVGGSIYLTGGHWEEDGYWDEMESFDIETGVWKERGPLPHLWLYHGCTSVIVTK